MAIVIPPGNAQMNLRMALEGSTQTAEVTFGLNFDELPAFVEVADAWSTGIMNRICNVWRFVNASARIEAGAIWEKAYTTLGGVSAASITPNVAALVRKTTSIPGRQNKGRMYVPGFAEANIDGIGTVNSSVVTEWNGYLATFLAAIAGAPSGGFGLMVIHHNSPSTLDPTNVDALILQPLVATQRRRLRG
jgi:hypothetical protein